VKSRTCVVLSFLAILSLAWGCTPLVQTPPVEMPPAPTATPMVAPTTAPATAGGETKGPAGELIIYPKEFIAYQNYLDVIGGKHGIADTGVIEATVISITRSEICPYQEEKCRIEPYPNDWGVVRVDKITSYTLYDAQQQPPEPGVEPPGGAESPGGVTSPGYTGPEQQSEKGRSEPLQEGQQVQTHFLLTVGPAKVRYVPMTESEGMEPAQLPDGDAQQTVGQPVQPPGETAFKPISREGDYLVFTTRIGDFQRTTEKILPRLEVGSRFRAEIQYDGTLYVEEYEVIP
jgi:hypothetical protein